jgi:hypothetical protein
VVGEGSEEVTNEMGTYMVKYLCPEQESKYLFTTRSFSFECFLSVHQQWPFHQGFGFRILLSVHF